jgi:hypothetical protein
MHHRLTERRGKSLYEPRPSFFARSRPATSSDVDGEARLSSPWTKGEGAFLFVYRLDCAVEDYATVVPSAIPAHRNTLRVGLVWQLFRQLGDIGCDPASSRVSPVSSRLLASLLYR